MNDDLRIIAARGEQLEAQLRDEAYALAAFYRTLRRERVPLLLAWQLTREMGRLRGQSLFAPAWVRLRAGRGRE